MNETINVSSPSIADPDPESARMLGILYAAYAVIGIPANLLILILTITNESVRAVPLNVCLFSLAFADMMALASISSSFFWALTFDIRVCKVGGVGIYIFSITSMTLPSCLAVCRHANLSSEQNLSAPLRALKTRKGIINLNMLFWIYGLLFTIPFIANDKFGLDPIGICGMTSIDTVFLWVYYMVMVVGPTFVGYTITFIFYGKLAKWVKKTSSLLVMSTQTHHTLVATRNLMRMMKWVLFFPFVFYYPAPICEYMLRLFPGIISVRTARFIMITMPLPLVCDPIFTIFFVKRYRTALMQLIRGEKGNQGNASVWASGTVGRKNAAQEYE